MLLFTPQKLHFEAWSDGSGVGQLREPEEKYLIIDGQHRLAALQFYERTHPDEAKSINVPCVIFDGRSEDFATEMFVIINSTPTRINKSHLVDLYERVSWAEPDRRFAAHIAEMLYREADSPLRYRINRLGGRSKQEKWILQAELFNEIHRWVKRAWTKIETEGTDKRPPRVITAWRGIFLKAAAQVWAEAWGNPDYMVTKPVTLKAMIRVCADLAAQDAEPEEDRVNRWSRAAGAVERADSELPQRGILRTLPGQGPGRARGPDSTGSRAGHRHPNPVTIQGGRRWLIPAIRKHAGPMETGSAYFRSPAVATACLRFAPSGKALHRGFIG